MAVGWSIIIVPGNVKANAILVTLLFTNIIVSENGAS